MIIKNIDLTRKEMLVMKKRSNKGSKLLPFQNEIMYMHKNQISNIEISRWLHQRGTISTPENIRQFCKRYLKDYESVEFEFNDENRSLNDWDSEDFQEEEDCEAIYEEDMKYDDL